MDKQERDDLISKIRVQFIYLETNFDGQNIRNPLVSFLSDTLPVSLAFGKAELTKIRLD